MCGHHRHPQQARRAQGVDLASEPARRVSTLEREQVIDQLKANTGAGHLDIDEFGDRVERALTARTAGELAPLVSDLADLRTAAQDRADRRADRRAALAPYLGVMALLVVIWAVSGFGGFWPIWPMLGWGIPLAIGLARDQSPGAAAPA
ncbi:DUF1707 domain-containing protein [soil metagenome]